MHSKVTNFCYFFALTYGCAQSLISSCQDRKINQWYRFGHYNSLSGVICKSLIDNCIKYEYKVNSEGILKLIFFHKVKEMD